MLRTSANAGLDAAPQVSFYPISRGAPAPTATGLSRIVL